METCSDYKAVWKQKANSVVYCTYSLETCIFVCVYLNEVVGFLGGGVFFFFGFVFCEHDSIRFESRLIKSLCLSGLRGKKKNTNKQNWAFMLLLNKLMKILIITPAGSCQIVWKFNYCGGDLT